MMFDISSIRNAQFIGYLPGSDVPVIRYDGHIYCLDEWDGERCRGTEYPGAITHRDKRSGFQEAILEGEPLGEVSIRPVYRFEAEGIDLESLEENSPEWEAAVEPIELNVI